MRFAMAITRFRPLAGMSVFPGVLSVSASEIEIQSFRPLAGMSVFPGRSHRTLRFGTAAFQTPCRDVGVSGDQYIELSDKSGYMFQTPCGDVGVSGLNRDFCHVASFRFQTPCGDVGVSGFGVTLGTAMHRTPVSDPLRGCRCFRATICAWFVSLRAVSDPLRGCRCFRVIKAGSKAKAERMCFRPLAGMSVFPGVD